VTPPLRFGCQFQIFRGRREFLDTARRVEDLGFAVATFPDHFGGWASPWPSVVAAASVTSTLRLGPMTINNDLWNPVVLARDAATADQLSEGRVELGIGAGWRAADYAVAGISEDPPRTRIARLAESLAVIRAYFGNGDGDADRLRPVQQTLPVFVGGGGRQILRLAASAADIIGVHVNLGGVGVAIGGSDGGGQATDDRGVLVDAVERRLAWIASDRPASLRAPELHLYVLDVRPGPSSVESAEATAATYGISPAAVVESPWFLTGPEEEMARKLIEINERYGISYFTVGEEHADTLHAVMGHI
jgi:probable F420-dependent oxidoreductase